MFLLDMKKFLKKSVKISIPFVQRTKSAEAENADEIYNFLKDWIMIFITSKCLYANVKSLYN